MFESGCTHLEDIVKSQIPFIKRHIQRHKYFQHIADDNDAMADFIQKYGFVFREMYCEYICKDNKECDFYKTLKVD